MTDESNIYNFKLTKYHRAKHKRIKHKSKVYVRGDVHTNTIEGFFSIFKRGMKGVYQHCGKQHLHRYLAEFDFRYTNRAATGCNDGDRADASVRAAVRVQRFGGSASSLLAAQ